MRAEKRPFDRREEGLRQKDSELQESLIKFNKFLQENESKRNRAEKRTMMKIGKLLKRKKRDTTPNKGVRKTKLECEKVKEKIKKNVKIPRFFRETQMRMQKTIQKYQTWKVATRL